MTNYRVRRNESIPECEDGCCHDYITATYFTSDERAIRLTKLFTYSYEVDEVELTDEQVAFLKEHKLWQDVS